jgi:hypothetical protein
MVSISVDWSAGFSFDIHVLKGEASPSLLARLIVVEHDGTRRLATTPPADIDPQGFRFEPNFASLVTPPFHSGITVNTSTGVVTVDQNRPAPPRLEQFVVEATARTKPPSPRTLGPIPIRVHVHDSITELWLTPSRLTVRRGTTGTRFTVLARFDDDTVGDISDRGGIEWSETDPVQPSNPRIKVHKTTGRLIADENVATVTVTAKHAGRTASAVAEAMPPWSQPLEAVLLRSRSAGIQRMAEVPNVLFLSDGFVATQRRDFEDLVRTIVDEVHDPGTGLRPFDLLKGEVNYWMAFVPSRNAGVSVLYDMNVVRRRTLVGEEIPLPERPPSSLPSGATLTLPQLIYAVGLPLPADRTATLQSKLIAWFFQYGPSVSTHVDSTVFLAWQNLHDHRLANEVDSAFGVGVGGRPQMHTPLVHRSAGFNERRVTAAHLEALLRNVRCQTATAAPMIGSIWADPKGTAPPPDDPSLPTGLKRGKDRGLMVFVLGGARFSGARYDHAIFVGVVDNVEVVLTPAANRQIDPQPHPFPATPSLESVARVAHEVAHSFNLRDEYGDAGKAMAMPDERALELGLIANVQPAKDLATSATDPRLHPARLADIKWLWPRISVAGVLVAKPAPAGANTFVIPLKKGHAAGFRRNDVVELRGQGLLPRPHESGRLTVTAQPDFAKDEVRVRPVPPNSITPGAWPPGSLLVRNVRGPAAPADPLGPDLLLVAPVILDHLGQSRIPLNRRPAPPGKPAPVCVRDDRSVQTSSKVVQVPGKPAATLKRPAHGHQIVGLYDGGHEHYCGAYHPSGRCLMRALVTGGTSPVVYPFCWVCSYFLVDRFDPVEHAVIERAFGREYPRL